MAQGKQVKDHISSAILDATANVVSKHGDAANMSEVADAAGISRATLYRYFPTRDDLLRALGTAAIEEINLLLVAADLNEAPVPEALARVTRAVIGSGVHFAVIAQHRQFVDPDEVECQVSTLIRAVFQRGVEDGTFRNDQSVEVLFTLWGGLLTGALRSMENFDNSVERASAAVSDVFFHGARAPETNR